MTTALHTQQLTKRYGTLTALRTITLEIPQGTIFGLLGPNGAGKSTLIKTLVGALRPTSGSCSVLGLNPYTQRQELRARIGYMPQGIALYDDLSARENIHFFGSLQQVDNLKHKVAHILEFTELSARADDPVYTFSGGMQKRVSLACALIHNPRILFLDEPTAAVDPHLRIKMWRLFRHLAAEGVTLFVSTHLMDEALMCDQLALIYQGNILACNTPEKILEQGHAHLIIQRTHETIERTISNTPQDLAQTLHAFGLDTAISSIRVSADSLETIILDLLERKKS